MEGKSEVRFEVELAVHLRLVWVWVWVWGMGIGLGEGMCHVLVLSSFSRYWRRMRSVVVRILKDVREVLFWVWTWVVWVQA